MALSFKTKDRLYYALVALLAGGIVVFGWFFVWRQHERRVDLSHDMEERLKTARSRLARPESIPGQQVVDALKARQQRLLDEYKHLADLYLAHDAPLERHILRGDRVDGIRIVLNYNNPNPKNPGLKQQWAAKVGNPDFLKVWPWERPNGVLAREQFGAVEKWCCIVDSVVDSLTAEGYVSVSSLTVGEAVVPEGVPAVPAVPWPVVRCEAYPVTVSFTAPFPKLAKILNRFIQRPDDQPCMALKGLSWQRWQPEEPEAGPTRGMRDAVTVTLEVWVYDFSLHKKD
jgi:hypothetical protein